MADRESKLLFLINHYGTRIQQDIAIEEMSNFLIFKDNRWICVTYRTFMDYKGEKKIVGGGS